MDRYTYDAFISYSHRDLKWGKWLQRKLEGFHVPRDLNPDRQGNTRLKVFRDQTDLAGAELRESLNRELARSRFLIVICSPASAASRWVNEEIAFFLSQGGTDRIIPFIISGEPLSDHPELECYPPLLRAAEEHEPLGVNIQEIGKNKAFLKTASVLMDIRFNRLVDREKQRKVRTALSIGSAALITAAVTGALVVRNIHVSRKNKELSFDIYAAAVLSLTQRETLQPEEIAFLQASAEEGNCMAMLYLADCYLNGWGSEKNPEAAFFWYQRAAEEGSSQGMVGTANCYLNGTGTEKNPEMVFYWDMQAALLEDSSAMLNVGVCYEEGIGTEPDPEKAFEWYEKSALAGNQLGMYHTARCYRAGLGTEASLREAFIWMRKLAEEGNTVGMYNVGIMYQNSWGTLEDPRQAYLWYRNAAELGDADAMCMLARCIENSYGVENVAMEWYQRAAEAGSREAMEELARLTSGDGTTEE